MLAPYDENENGTWSNQPVIGVLTLKKYHPKNINLTGHNKTSENLLFFPPCSTIVAQSDIHVHVCE